MALPDRILLESGDRILLEIGDGIIIEPATWRDTISAAMGVSQIAGTITKLIAVPLAGAMGTSQMAGTIRTQLAKILYWMLDRQIDADMYLDTSLVNEDDPRGRV